MTDKEKLSKVRAEIERLKDVDVTEFPSTNWVKGRNFALVSLEVFIDSMQEEPTTSVWHDAKEIPPDDIIVFRYIDGLTTCRYVGQTMKDVVAWAYFKDLKKL